MLTPAETLREMLDSATRLQNGDISQVDKLADFYAETTDVRHPMAPLEDHALLSRDELRNHFAAAGGAGGTPGGLLVEDVRVHETADPEVFVGEFTYRGSSGSTASNVIICRIRDGVIVESRDYIDYVGLARASGTLRALCAQLVDAD